MDFKKPDEWTKWMITRHRDNPWNVKGKVTQGNAQLRPLLFIVRN